jgi:hypothetical protein
MRDGLVAAPSRTGKSNKMRLSQYPTVEAVNEFESAQIVPSLHHRKEVAAIKKHCEASADCEAGGFQETETTPLSGSAKFS